jgi:uncharacterized RDD family membrane protein YckC
MKCPKCHYLSFEPEPRCRNCGYDLEFAAGDLELRPADAVAVAPPLDLELRGADEPRAADSSLRLLPDPDRPSVRPMRPRERRSPPPHSPLEPPTAPAPPPEPPQASPISASPPSLVPSAPIVPPATETAPPQPVARARTTTSELPLFIKAMERLANTDSDEPLVSVPAEPRPPLSVRRRAADVRDARGPVPVERRAPVLPSMEGSPAHPTPAGVTPAPDVRDPAQVRAEARALVRAVQGAAGDDSSPAMRAAAAAIDLAIVGGIATVTILLTLRILDRPFADVLALPIAPLSAFLLMMAVGYLLLFTVAAGQTIGKMALGLKVIASDDASAERIALSPAQAAARALATVPSVLAFGLGFLPALLSGGRAVHDRLAHTRVVRA